jgi:FkbM family methyltransferase
MATTAAKELAVHALHGASRRLTDAADRLMPPPPPPPVPEADVRVQRWREANGDRTFRVEYDLDAGSTVWDVGGYEGDWTAEIAARYRSTVEVFEPVAAFVTLLRTRFARNPSVSIHEFGLGGSTRIEEIVISDDSSSTYRTGNETESIRIVDIVAHLRESETEHVDLMKLNIEGAEFEVLERLLDANEIERIQRLQVQFHDFLPDAAARRTVLVEALDRMFERTYSFPWVWEGWERGR